MKAICVVSHYFGVSEFSGGSTTAENVLRRKRIVERTINQIHSFRDIVDIDVLVCGIGGSNLVKLDLDVSKEVLSPTHIPWSALSYLVSQLDHYDFFLYVEDDILIPKFVLRRMIAAAKKLPIDEIFIPNRLELMSGFPVVVDLVAIPGWTGYSRSIGWRKIYQANNPHTGLLFMSRAQWARATLAADFSEPAIIIGGYQASALAKAHSGFRLLRERSAVPTHFVIHQDRWIPRNNISLMRAVRAHLDGYRG